MLSIMQVFLFSDCSLSVFQEYGIFPEASASSIYCSSPMTTKDKESIISPKTKLLNNFCATNRDLSVSDRMCRFCIFSEIL